MSHYKIVNTSKKPGVKKGQHKLGFYVALGDKRPFGPGKSHVVTEITPGILTLQQKGYVSIEALRDIEDTIKKQIRVNEKVQQEAEKERVKALVVEKETALNSVKEELNRPIPKDFSNLDTGLNKQEMKDKAKISRGNVSVAKVDGVSTDPLDGLEESLNPDGEPNFVVKAKKRSRKK
jgi:hypothetical protein